MWILKSEHCLHAELTHVHGYTIPERTREHTHTHTHKGATWPACPCMSILPKLSYRSVSTHRHTIWFVLIISAYHSWQVWCPFIQWLRGRNCWHGHLSHEFRASGVNLLTPLTVSGRNLNKEVKLNADNFFCTSSSYALALIFHTCFHILFIDIMTLPEPGLRKEGNAQH